MQTPHGFPLPMLLLHPSALPRVQGVLCSLCPQDWQLKLALVQSVTEVSSAIQAVGDCGSFELGLKQKVMWTLLVSVCSWGSETGEFGAAPCSAFPRGTMVCRLGGSCWSCVPSWWGPWVPWGIHGGDGAASVKACQQGRAVPCPCGLPTLCLCLWASQDWLEREPWDSLVHGVLQPLEKLR